MRAREFITDHKAEKLDEFLPLIAAAGGALARGAVAGGTALARGAATAGGAALRGAANIGGKIAQGVGQAGTKIAQGAQQVGTKVAQGAQTAVKQMATGTAGSSGSSTASTPPQSAAKPAPVSIPQGVSIEPAPAAPGDNPNEIKFNMGGATFTLDTKDPKNAQAVQQLKQQMAAPQ